MAETSEDGESSSEADFISLQDVLYSFNNSVGEEQAWAVCFQCAQYLLFNDSKDVYRDIYYYGSTAIRLSKHGDVKIYVNFSRDTGKGSPRKRNSFSLSREYKSVITQIDATQALGTALYKALDFGLSESEEPHLSSDLECLIEFMTDHPTDDDEGIDIERDSDDSQGKDQSVFQDIIDLCVSRLSDKPNGQVHYKAVCRALATEAKELLTFLDNISKGQERLQKSGEKPDTLEDLHRNDWARLWVQTMRDLRHGVRLKKVEQVHLSPLDYELTPFEILLEDIKLGRYKLNRIMVNGDIPPLVKHDAHAVILDFIRSRPPLKPVNKRVLKTAPKREMNPREKIMADICKPQALRPVKKGKVVVGVKKPMQSCDISSDEDSPKPVRKVIKPVAAFQVSTDDSDSYFSDTDEDGHHHSNGHVMSHMSPILSPDNNPTAWKRAVAKDLVSQPSNCNNLTRRHTISACDVKNGTKVPVSNQHATVYEECQDPDTNADSFVRSHASRKPTKLVSYRQKHGENVHVNDCDQDRVSSPSMHDDIDSRIYTQHAGHGVLSKSHGNLVDSVVPSQNQTQNHKYMHGSSYRIARSVNCISVSQPQRSASPGVSGRHCVRSVSPCQHAGRSESPVRHLSRSETFTYSVPRKTQNCVHKETHITARSDSPQTRHMTRSESFPVGRCESPHGSQRCESPRRHSMQAVREIRDASTHHNHIQSSHSATDRVRRHTVQHVHGNHRNVSMSHDACSRARSPVRHKTHSIHSVRRHVSSVGESQYKHDRCVSPNHKQYVPERCESPCCHSNRSRSQSPSQLVTQNVTDSVVNSVKTEPNTRISSSSLQERRSVHIKTDSETSSNPDSKSSQRQRHSIIRARSRPEIRTNRLLSSLKDAEEENFAFIENLAKDKTKNNTEVECLDRVSKRSASVTDVKRPLNSCVSRAVSSSSRPERIVRDNGSTSDAGSIQTVPNMEKTQSEADTEGELKSRRDSRLSRQTAIRTGRTDVRSRLHSNATNKETENSEKNGDNSNVQNRESRSRRVGVVFKDNVETSEQDSKSVTATPENNEITQNSDLSSPSQEVTSPQKETLPRRQVRPILRSRSEVRPRSEMKPLKPMHDYQTGFDNNNLENSKANKMMSLSSADVRHNHHDNGDTRGPALDTVPDLLDGDIPDVIKTAHSQLKVMDLLHVSWKSECPRAKDDTNSSNTCSDCRPPSHKWQNPIECLSLTLEEVTHIRMVLTKAELESLITDTELYTLVSKGKVCFTCKKTKFSLFGQWGTKCKFCQRNVCNYCLRKMNVPTEHFQKIPVYSLSPVPISPEVLEALKVYESTGSVPHSPSLTHKPIDKTGDDKPTSSSPSPSPDTTPESTPGSENKVANKRRTLQRSHTIGVGMGSRLPPNRALLKGPQMSICCDCKSMIMEIIRASRTTVSLISHKDKEGSDPKPALGSQNDTTHTPNLAERVPRRPRHLDLDDRPRPKSMLANINFRSFNFSKLGNNGSDA